MLEKVNGVYRCLNWDKRQFASDNSSERVKKHRQSKQEKIPPAESQEETLQKRYNDVTETPPETETDPETDIYIQQQQLRAREENFKTIQTTLERSGVLIPSPVEIESLTDWVDQGIELDAVCFAIEKAALAGQRKVSYVNGTLRNWMRAGITTKTQAEAEQIEFEQRKARDGPKGGQVSGKVASGNKRQSKPGFRPSEVDWEQEGGL